MTTYAEQHYTPAQLADKYQVSHHTIRRAFKDYPGVLRIRLGTERELLRIPASVAARWHEAHSRRWDEIQRRRR